VTEKGLAVLAAAQKETTETGISIGIETGEGEANPGRGEGARPLTGGGMTEPGPLLLRTRKKKSMIGPKPRRMIIERVFILCL
jgi:hypothetical protein